MAEGPATARLDFILSGVLRVAYYRSLHIVSVPFGPDDVLAYAQEQAAGGRFGGAVFALRTGPALSLYAWRNVRVGEGLLTDFYFFGAPFGEQTVIVRKGFYKGNFAQREARPRT